MSDRKVGVVADWLRGRPASTAQQVTRIVSPVAHRRVERERMQTVALPGWHVVVPDNDDDWCCDNCLARLDPHAPIMAVGSYALCADEAAEVLASSDLVVTDCQCPGCQGVPGE